MKGGRVNIGGGVKFVGSLGGGQAFRDPFGEVKKIVCIYFGRDIFLCVILKYVSYVKFYF